MRIILLVTACLFLFAQVSLGRIIPCNAVLVKDGDTLVISDAAGKYHNVELYGIDAPELDQVSGSWAKEMLNVMVSDKDLTYTAIDTAENGSQRVILHVNGVSVNAAMVKSGNAWVIPGNCETPNCKDWKNYQQIADKGNKGLWRYYGAVPPWKWRTHGVTSPVLFHLS